MKIRIFVIVLFTLGLINKNANAGFISEIAFDYKRYYNGYFNFCNDGHWSSGGGISLGKELGKDKVFLFSGFNYLPTFICNSPQPAKYIQLPLELRCYFFKRIIFLEAGIDVRWLSNSKSEDWQKEELSQYVQTFTPGYGLAFGVQQDIRRNLFLYIKGFISNGISTKYRTADPTNCGLEVEIAFAFN